MKRLIIFDLDGTVGDTLSSLAYTANLCLEKLGLPPSPEENFNFYAGDGARIMLERCLLDVGDKKGEHLEEFLSLYREAFKTGCTYHVKSYPGLPETLARLKEYGMLLAVCTNKAQPYAEAVIHRIYGDSLFDMIVGEQEGIPRKPDPTGVLYIAEKLGATPEECVYVGDSDTDMQTGKNADMYTVGVTWGFRSRSELEAYKPDWIIDTPGQLMELEIG